MASSPRRGLGATGLVLALVAVPAASATAAGGGERPRDAGTTVTLLHANDLESALLPIERDGAPYAGAARFVELLQREQRAAQRAKTPLLTLNGGDNFLPGAQLDASRDEDAERFYDARAFEEGRFDVSAIGNHDFDLGPDFFAEYLGEVDRTPFVAANLDVSGEPALRARADDGTIVASTVVRDRGQEFGVIGLTTPELPELTTVGEVTVDPDLAGIANAQAAALAERGVDKVVLISHLQDIDNEIALVPQLTGVDVVVGAGGGEVMASPGDPLLPQDAVSTDAAGAPLSYPTVVTAADGAAVPVVTTSGLYRYLGKLVLTFDGEGDLTGFDDGASRPIPVTSTGPDAVQPDRRVARQVEEPVAEYVAELGERVVATTEVPLDGTRAGVRSTETNLGNLVADSLLAAGRQQAEEAGTTPPRVALQNGGGIRNDSVIPAGELTELDTFTVLPFANFVSVAPEVPVAAFVAAVEHGSVAGAGSFAQVAGFSYVVDPAAEEGSRVRQLTLDDGTPVVVDGAVVLEGALSVASIDFLLRGNDGYDAFTDVPFEVFPVAQQEAFADYLQGELGGTVTATDYPEGGEGRITPLP